MNHRDLYAVPSTALLGTSLAQALVMKKTYKVLLVDDEPQILRSLKRTLRGDDLEIHMASTPHEAFEILAHEDIDLIISDHDMPHMKGLDLLQRVRLTNPSIVRILLTARSEMSLAIRALNEGAVNKFLLKPWDRVDLRGMLDIALRSAGASAAVAPRAAEPVAES